MSTLDSKATKDKFVLNTDTLVQKYRQWFDTDPFEFDTSVNLALKSANNANEASEKAKKMNSSSMTNSALGRILPLAIMTSKLETSEEVKKAVIKDVELTHANPVVQEMIFVYCDTLRFLLCYTNDEERA